MPKWLPGCTTSTSRMLYICSGRQSFATPKILCILRTALCCFSPVLATFDQELYALSLANISLDSPSTWIRAALPVGLGRSERPPSSLLLFWHMLLGVRIYIKSSQIGWKMPLAPNCGGVQWVQAGSNPNETAAENLERSLHHVTQQEHHSKLQGMG